MLELYVGLKRVLLILGKIIKHTIDCLGLVNGICCPHYDEEPERIPYVKKILESKEISNCYAIEGYAALHLVDDVPKYNVSFGKTVRHVTTCSLSNDTIRSR